MILFRRPASGLQVFWVRRGSGLSFAGGFHAFPGGKLDPDDGRVPVEGFGGEAAALRATAARELLEEAGVLLVQGRVSAERIRSLRTELLEGKVPFSELLARHSLSVDGGALRDAGRYVTPAWLPVRFDCRFFLVEVSAQTEVEIITGELVEGTWVSPAAALEQWEQGSALLHPPNLFALQVMARFSTTDQALAELQSPPELENLIPTRVEFQKGIQLLPLQSPTLPPATHTNCYLLGNGDFLIVDPGATEPAEAERLFRRIAVLEREGRRPVAVVLTHHHGDHIGGALGLKTRLNLPVWCHARTADRLPFPAQRILREGEQLVLEGKPTMTFRVLHTPGHARGHLCLLDESSRAAVVGDMVAGLGTILIDPPEGDMGEYLRQLKRLQQLPVGALYPAHGPPLPDGPAKLSEYLEHRRAREARVSTALAEGPAELETLSARAYADTPTAWPVIAERSTHAILLKLCEDGLATCVGGVYSQTA